jgi:ABC-type nitrate/sulfonate/bicarbonate transport system permease component
LFQVLMVLRDPLPFAFVGMFFGETVGSTKGLGFSMIVARSSGNSPKAMALFLIIFLLLLSFRLFISRLSIRIYPVEATRD